MSVNIKQLDGSLKKIAGSTVILDATVSEIREGTWTNTEVDTATDGTRIEGSVTFDVPMPNTNYIVVYDKPSSGHGESFCYETTSTKTTTGFSFFVTFSGVDKTYTSLGLQIHWYAIRLVELEGYTELQNKVNNPDSIPTINSANLVESGGVYTAINDIAIQKTELPTPSLDEVGKIYQYIGNGSTYTNGNFYKCIETSGSYNWTAIDFGGGVAIENVETLPTTNIENKFYRDVSEQTIDLVFHKNDVSLEYFQDQLKKIGFVTDGVLVDKGNWKYYDYIPTYEVRYNFTSGKTRVRHAQLYTVFNEAERVTLVLYGLVDNVNVAVFAGDQSELTIYYDDNKLYAGNNTEQVLDRVALMSDVVDKNAVIYVDTVPSVDEYETGAVICYSGEDSGMFKKGHHYQKVDNIAIEKKCGMATDFKYQTYDTVYFDADGTVLTDVQNSYNQTEATVEGESSSSWTNCVGFNSEDYAQSNKIRVITHEEDPDTLYYCKLILDLDTNVITAGERIDIGVNDYAQHVYTVNYIGIGAGWADIGGGGDEEFIGTQAEWDALTTEEKEKYDGKIVNITNDTTAGGGNTTEFIGTQSEWDALSDATKAKYEIVNITDDDIGENIVVGTITRNTSISESINEVFAQKYGKIAQIHACINGCIIPADTLTLIATTSLKPACEAWMLVSTDYVADGLRCFLGASGSIQILCPTAGTYNIRFDATYITKD